MAVNRPAQPAPTMPTESSPKPVDACIGAFSESWRRGMWSRSIALVPPIGNWGPLDGTPSPLLTMLAICWRMIRLAHWDLHETSFVSAMMRLGGIQNLCSVGKLIVMVELWLFTSRGTLKL